MTENTPIVENNRGLFQKGRQKTGGRKKGTPNKKTRAFLEELGEFRTVKEMVNLFYKTKDESIKYNILKEFLKYEYPQRKAVEMCATLEAEETTQEAFLNYLKALGKGQ